MGARRLTGAAGRRRPRVMRRPAFALCFAAACAALAGCGAESGEQSPAGSAAGSATASPAAVVLKGDLLTREGEVEFGHDFHPGDYVAYGIHLHSAMQGIGRIYVDQAPGSSPAQVASIEIAAPQDAVLAYYRAQAQETGFTIDTPDAAAPGGERGFVARYVLGGATFGVTAQPTDTSGITETALTITLTDPALARKVAAAMARRAG